ncbi:hypothetical protein BI317_16685 [Xanthomonas hortorum pv. gardneri]|uniref:conjugal transfer protein TraD n=1 Tax=Xanthomonas hortorum TaxID=56454 RepID=UPI0009385887|nr:conjugal transfer protein TraD [Xanthomonas hortorum]APP85566.1 hypothetical protein BI317_16685 [Xanthomonas hortorum pv. gardneri]
MTEPNHYHQRIQRATEHLAQLQARNLLTTQRQAAKARATQRRKEAKRRVRIAELVFLAGAETLDDAELLGTLLQHVESRHDHNIRDEARSRGVSHLKMVDVEDDRIKH